MRHEVVVHATACTGCGVCVETCPPDVLRLDETTGKAKVAYPTDCQACYLCVIDCAFHGAIEVNVILDAATRATLDAHQEAV